MPTRGRSSRKPPLKCNLLRKDYSPDPGSDRGERERDRERRLLSRDVCQTRSLRGHKSANYSHTTCIALQLKLFESSPRMHRHRTERNSGFVRVRFLFGDRESMEETSNQFSSVLFSSGRQFVMRGSKSLVTGDTSVVKSEGR